MRSASYYYLRNPAQLFTQISELFFKERDWPLVITYGIQPNFLRKSWNFFLKRAIVRCLLVLTSPERPPGTQVPGS